jgi:arylsulfatase A-like enzyme
MGRGVWLAFTVVTLLTQAANGRGGQDPRMGGARRPNLIYIYADDLGYGEIGAYGQQKIRTPNLDRLAREGLRFTQHYTGAPVCAPARAMLLTGRHAGHSYIRGNYELGGFPDRYEGGQMPLYPGVPTIAGMLKAGGYATGAAGKWGLGMHDNTGDPNAHGFDYFFGYLDQKQAHNHYPSHLWENGRRVPLQNAYFSPHQKLLEPPADLRAYERYTGVDYAPDAITGRALDFIERNRDAPFFLYLAYTLPHLALQAPRAAVQEYVGRFDESPYLGEKGYLPTPHPLSTYAAMITTLDGYVGRVMAHLRELGLEERTLVMFSSDNGPTFDVGGVKREYFDSAGGLRGGKTDVYEGGIREPFIARWPGRVPAGQVTDLVSTQFDLMATLADLTGLEAPPNDGLSLLPTLLGNPAAQRQHEFVYFEFPENGGQVAVRRGNWTGVKVGMKANSDSAWQLFDLSSDRAEEHDVAPAHPEILRELDAIVNREHRRAHIREWEFIDNRVPEGER